MTWERIFMLVVGILLIANPLVSYGWAWITYGWLPKDFWLYVSVILSTVLSMSLGMFLLYLSRFALEP